MKETGKVERVGLGCADVRIGGTLYRSVPVVTTNALLVGDRARLDWLGDKPRVTANLDRPEVPEVADTTASETEVQITFAEIPDITLVADEGEAMPDPTGTIGIPGGQAITTTGFGTILQIDHGAGDFGDLHENYGETYTEEAITAAWDFQAGFKVGTDVVFSEPVVETLRITSAMAFILDVDGEVDISGELWVHGDFQVGETGPAMFIDVDNIKVGIAAGTDLSGYAASLIVKPGTDRHGIHLKAVAAMGPTTRLLKLSDTSDNDLIIIDNSGDVMSGNYVGGMDGAGWILTHDGRLEASSAFIRGALYATTFAYKEVNALNGYFMVTNAAPLKKALIADEGDVWIYVEDPVFAEGSVLRCQTLSSLTGGVTIQLEWMQVQADAGNGVWDATYEGYAYKVDRHISIYGGGTLCAWQKGTAVTEWGRGSAGGWVTMVGGSTDAEGPYVQATRRTGASVENYQAVTRFGNVRGTLGFSEDMFGIVTGDLTAGSKHYFASYREADGDAIFTLHGVEFNIYDSAGNQRGKIDPSATGTETLFWLGSSVANQQLTFSADGVLSLETAVIGNSLGGMGDWFFSRADGLMLLGPGGLGTSTTEWRASRNASATIAGAYHVEQGAWLGTRALVVEPATTNYILNPSFESWGATPNDWTVYGTPTITQVTNATHGSSAVQIVTSPSVDSEGLYQDVSGLTAGQTYVISAWAYGISDVCRIGAFDGGTFSNGVYSSAATNGRWQRVSVQKVCPAGGGIRVYLSNASMQTASMIFDAVQLELASVATTYCDGSLGAGYSWSGTAHRSTSSRAATSLTLGNYVVLVSGNATASYRAVVQAPYGAADAWPATSAVLWSMRGADDNNRVELAYDSTNDYFVLYINGANRITTAAQTFAAGDWLDFVATLDFTNDSYILYLNGLQVGSTYTGALTVPTITSWRLGTDYGGSSYYWYGAVAEYAVFDRVLTSGEASGLHMMGTPLIDGGAINKPGIYIMDGMFRIASSTDPSINRLELTSSALAIGDDVTPTSGTGIWLGLDSGTPKMLIGDAAANHMDWNGSTLAITGTITASAGTIGGFTLSGTQIASTDGKLVLDSSSKYIAINSTTFGNSGIQLQYNSGTPRFYVGNGSSQYIKYDGTNVELASGGGSIKLTSTSNILFSLAVADQGVVWKNNFTSNYDCGIVKVQAADDAMVIQTGGSNLVGFRDFYLTTVSTAGSRTVLQVVAASKRLVVYSTPTSATLGIRNNGDGDWPVIYAQQVSNSKAVAHFDQDVAGQPVLRLDGPTTGAPGALSGYIRININGTDKWMPYYNV